MMMAKAGSFLFFSSTRTESWNIKFLPYIYIYIARDCLAVSNTSAFSEFGNQQRRRQKTYITKLLKALVFLSNNPEIP
jgi:hypothetical protein